MKVVAFLCIFIGSLSLMACNNTVSGFGKDLKRAGDAIDKAATKDKDGYVQPEQQQQQQTDNYY